MSGFLEAVMFVLSKRSKRAAYNFQEVLLHFLVVLLAAAHNLSKKSKVAL